MKKLLVLGLIALYLTLNCQNDIKNAESILTNAFFDSGYDVEVIIKPAPEKDLYDIHISTVDPVKRFDFIELCCSGVGTMMRYTSFKTNRLYLSFNEEYWYIKTKYCRDIFAENGSIIDNNLKKLRTHLIRVK